MMLLLAHGNNAAVGDFADFVFKLDRGVHDAEVVVQALFHVAQNSLAHRWRNVRDRDVARERAALRADVPDVQVVNVVHALDFAQRGFEDFKIESAGSAF